MTRGELSYCHFWISLIHPSQFKDNEKYNHLYVFVEHENSCSGFFRDASSILSGWSFHTETSTLISNSDLPTKLHSLGSWRSLNHRVLLALTKESYTLAFRSPLQTLLALP